MHVEVDGIIDSDIEGRIASCIKKSKYIQAVSPDCLIIETAGKISDFKSLAQLPLNTILMVGGNDWGLVVVSPAIGSIRQWI